MCHYHICLDVHNIRENVNGLKSWADYLFSSLEGAPEEIQTPVADVDIEAMMVVNGHGDVILKDDDGIYEKGDKFKSFTIKLLSHVSIGLASGLLVHFANEVCCPVSFARRNLANDALFCHPVGLWTCPWTAPTDGLLYSAWALDADRGVLQGSDNQEGRKRTRPSS